MKNSAYLLIAHGSKDSTAGEVFQELLLNLRGIVKDRRVEACYLEASKPLLKDQLEHLYQEGIRTFFLIPLLLFPGRHVRTDIPQILADFRMRFSDADLHLAAPLGSDPMLLHLLESKMQAIEKTISKTKKNS